MVYYTAKKIDPFFCPKQLLPLLGAQLQTYLSGLNNIEHALLLTSDVEMDLLAFLQVDLPESSDLVNERRAFLEKGSLTRTFIDVKIDKAKVQDKLCVAIQDSFVQIAAYENRNEYCGGIRRLITNSNDFKIYYNRLRNSDADSPESQGSLYEIHFLERSIPNFFTAFQKTALHLAALFPKSAPPLPTQDHDELLSAWYEQLKQVYATHYKAHNASQTAFIMPEAQSVPTTVANQAVTHSSKKSFACGQQVTLVSGEQDALFAQWQQHYLEPRGPSSHPPGTKDPVKKEINVDPLYAPAIRAHSDYYEKDCQIAHSKQEKKQIFKRNLKKEEYSQLINRMEEECKRANAREETLRKDIDKFMKRVPTDTFLSYARTHAETLSKKKQQPSEAAVLRAACQPNAIEALCQMNPYLAEDEVRELRNSCIELMAEHTHLCHLERIYKPLQQWLDSGQKNTTLFEQAQMAMVEQRHYDPAKHCFALLFEYFSGMRARQKQALVINDVLLKIFTSSNLALQSCAFQLIMAGGKTNVILSILVELIAEAGLAPCILCHHSQFVSAKGSFLAFQSKRFGKDLYILDFSIQDLSDIKKLDLIYQRLKEAQKRKCPVVMKSSFPPILQLKFYLESLRLTSITQEPVRTQQIEIIERLREINRFLLTQAIGLYDECDINLSMLTDVTFSKEGRKI